MAALRDIWREQVGTAITRVRQLSGLSLKEFAARIGRESRQVARWEQGTERPQFDALYAVELFRPFLAVAMSELAGAEITTQITVKRSA